MHTNDEYYATPGGLDKVFGQFSIDFIGGQAQVQNLPYRFYKVDEGGLSRTHKFSMKCDGTGRLRYRWNGIHATIIEQFETKFE